MTDVESEKTESFELGHIAQLNDISEELRERGGETYAHSSSRTELEKARQLKSLAEEFEDRAQDKRDQWENKWKDTDRGAA